jgi:hypothetical protein
VQSCREAVQQCHNMRWQCCTFRPFLWDRLHLQKIQHIHNLCKCFLRVLSNTSKVKKTSHTVTDHQLSKVYPKFLNLPLGLRVGSSTAL